MLVVDAANVVGSVPDGWWRDRAGAAGRLHAHLLAEVSGGALPYDRVELVLEGQGRRGVPAGVDDSAAGQLVTVHASGEGDDEIVARCARAVEVGEEVSVATADRGLIARLSGRGVAVVGPRSVRG